MPIRVRGARRVPGEGETGGDGDGSPGWVGRPGGSLGWGEAKSGIFLTTVMMVIVTVF